MSDVSTPSYIRTDPQGRWTFDVTNGLAPGFHRIVVSDANGTENEGGFYVTEGEPAFLAQLRTFLHPAFGIGFAALTAALVILFGWFAAERRRSSLDRMGVARMRHRKRAWAFASIGVIVAVLSFAAWRSRFVLPWIAPGSRQTVVRTVSVAGALQSPINRQGIAGVDLTAGDTTIHTSEGGRFTFPQARTDQGIRANHPDLKRAIVYRVESSGVQDLLFDVSLMNAMVALSELEARGQTSFLYALLPAEIRAKVTETEFARLRVPLFRTSNLTDQTLEIGAIRYEPTYVSRRTDTSWRNVVVVTLVNGNAEAEEAFTHQNGRWELLF